MKTRSVIVIATVGSLLLGASVLVHAAANFDLWWHVIAGGGGRSASSSYAIQGSIGQPVAGSAGSSSYRVGAGFWPSGAAAAPTATRTATVGPPPTLAPYRLHLPVIVRQVWKGP
jgi:hypothetical protein